MQVHYYAFYYCIKKFLSGCCCIFCVTQKIQRTSKAISRKSRLELESWSWKGNMTTVTSHTSHVSCLSLQLFSLFSTNIGRKGDNIVGLNKLRCLLWLPPVRRSIRRANIASQVFQKNLPIRVQSKSISNHYIIKVHQSIRRSATTMQQDFSQHFLANQVQSQKRCQPAREPICKCENCTKKSTKLCLKSIQDKSA